MNSEGLWDLDHRDPRKCFGPGLAYPSFLFVGVPMKVRDTGKLFQIKRFPRPEVFARDHYLPRVVTTKLTIRETDARDLVARP